MTTDPVTTEVIWNTLTSYTDEMADALERSAYSPMIRDVRDFCSGLVDLDGRVIAYNTGGLPAHFVDIGEDVLDGLEMYGREGFSPGDAVMMNANYYTGQHANNVLIYVPIFSDNELVGFASTRAHWQDIGGITANRPSFGTTDSIQEGLQVRSVKVYEEGEPREDIIRLIKENLRQPDVSLGDLRAQIGACRIGEKRYKQILEDYDIETIFESVEDIWDRSETLTREAVREIPDGEYSAESKLDDDGFESGHSIPIKVRVIVEDDEMTVDLSELSEQVRGPLNSNSMAPIYFAFKALTTPHRPPDMGFLRPLNIEIPEGKIISAQKPAAMGSWSWPYSTIIDTIFKALSPAIPEKVPAGNCGMPYGAGFFYGGDEDGNQFISSDILPVGWGGRPNGDGQTATGFELGSIRDCPAEITEALYPIRVERYGLREGSAGPGKYRGGFGVVREYRTLAETFNNGEITRVDEPAWGLFGGEEGEPAYNTFVDQDGNQEHIEHGYMNRRIKKGSRLLVRTGGGGGYGDPFERDPELVREDVIDEYISRDEARRDYGVVIDDQYEVAEAATEKARRT